MEVIEVLERNSSEPKRNSKILKKKETNSFKSRNIQTKIGFGSNVLRKMATYDLLELKRSVAEYIKSPQKFKNEEYIFLFTRILKELCSRNIIFETVKDKTKLLGRKRNYTKEIKEIKVIKEKTIFEIKIPSFLNDFSNNKIIKKQNYSTQVPVTIINSDLYLHPIIASQMYPLDLNTLAKKESFLDSTEVNSCKSSKNEDVTFDAKEKESVYSSSYSKACFKGKLYV